MSRAYNQGFSEVLPYYGDASKPCGGGYISEGKECHVGKTAQPKQKYKKSCEAACRRGDPKYLKSCLRRCASGKARQPTVADRALEGIKAADVAYSTYRLLRG